MKNEVMTNLESVGDMVGALMGMGDGLEEDTYMEALIGEAHEHTANAFDIAAVATASAGAISHVFEYGVVGVTPGQVRFADPTSPDARLYQHVLTGHGGNQDVGYIFRPARNRNPHPTTASTGVPSKYLAKLSQRKYIFWNKAFVMETGQTVEIKSNRGEKGLLFVPTPGNNSPKGFVMYPTRMKGPIFNTPGRAVQGNFTAFWQSWWAQAGSKIMEMEMRKMVEYDIKRAQMQADRRAKAEAMKPVHTVNILGASSTSRKTTKKIVSGYRKAKKRMSGWRR